MKCSQRMRVDDTNIIEYLAKIPCCVFVVQWNPSFNAAINDTYDWFGRIYWYYSDHIMQLWV
jgi:hypothetical protein